jgi:hypothetical protein
MFNSLGDRFTSLSGYIGCVEISTDFELLENSTTRDSETMAELCGVLIGYLKVRQASSNKVLSVSVVCSSFVHLMTSTSRGFLLLQFERDKQLNDVWSALDEILVELKATL